MALLATVLMCTAMSAGCGGPPAVPASHQATGPASRFAISYVRSGGLAATRRVLVIRPGRHAMASIRRAPWAYPKTIRFRVGIERVEGLRRALARAEFATIESPAPGPAVCADCFEYEISYRGHAVDFDQNEVPDGLSVVLRELEAVIATH